jgi:hypothetical protein
LGKERQKKQAESALLWQKALTEARQITKAAVTSIDAAQSSATAAPKPVAYGSGTGDDGIAGEQAKLLAAQKDGFKKDAIQKLLKIFADTLAVQVASGGGTVTDTTGMSAQYVGKVATKAAADHGVTLGSLT